MSKKIKMIAIFIALFLGLLQSQEWQPIGPLSGKFLSVEWNKSNENEIFASYSNSIFKSVDHGNSWDVCFGISEGNYQDFMIFNLFSDPSNSETLYFAGKILNNPNLPENGLYRSTDGGLTFDLLLSAPVDDFIIHPTSGKIITFHGSDSCRNMKVSSNSGLTFSEIQNPPLRIKELAFDPSNDNIVYATSYYGLYKTINGGESWDLIGFENQELKLCYTNPNQSDEIWIGSPMFCDNEFLYKSIDGGSNWDLVDLPYTQSFSDHPHQMVIGLNSNNIYIAETNEVFVSNDGGLTWSVTSFNIDTEYYYPNDMTMNCNDENEIIVVTDNLAKQTANGGVTWEPFQIVAGESEVIETAVNPNGGYYLYSGNCWGINRYDSFNNSWTDMTQPGIFGIGVKAIGIDNNIPGLVIKGIRNSINNGIIYKSTDYCSTGTKVWDNMDDQGGFITEIIKSPVVDGLFYGVTWDELIPAQFIKSTDNGDTWVVLDQSGSIHSKMTDIVVDYQNPDNIFIFGNGIVSKSVDGGVSFIQSCNGIPFEGVYDGTINPYDGNILFVSVTSGIFKTVDGGNNWFQVAQSDDSAIRIEYNPVFPAMIAAVTFNEKIIISYDNGVTWNDITGLINANFNDVTFSPDGKQILVSTTSQGIYRLDLDDSYLIPKNLISVVNGFNVQLSWEDVSGIENYSVYLDGVKVDTTSESNYSDFYLQPGNHTYNVASMINGIESNLSNSTFVVIDGSDLPAPRNLDSHIENFRDIVLDWDEPSDGNEPVWLHYDNGSSAGSWETMVGGTFDIVVRYTPDDLDDFDGKVLSEIRFYPTNEFGNHWARVWIGDDLVVDDQLSNLNFNTWNSYILPEPISIDITKELTFGIKVEAFFGPISSYDSGPSVKPGYSDLILMGSTQYTLADYGYNTNNNIQGCIISQDLKSEKNIIGYKMYKEGSYLATISNNEELTYSDINLEFGNYHYAVTAIYDDGESVPSNELFINLKDPFSPPKDLHYEIVGANDVKLLWTSPDFQSNEIVDLKYSNSNDEGRLNFMIGSTIDAFIKFSSEDLEEYVGSSLISISFKPVNNFGNYTLKVLKGDGVEIYTEVITEFNYNEMTEFQLSTPLTIPNNEDIWFGFSVEIMGGDAVSYDSQSTVKTGFSDIIGFGGTWRSLAEYGISGNNNIIAKVSNSTGSITPVLTGYKVYKDNEILTELNDPNILGYTDNNVTFDFTHSYAVSALYGNEESVLSIPVSLMISNPYIAPINLTVNQVSITNVLNWEMPEDIYKLHWDDGICNDGLGSTEGGDLMAGIRFAPEHLPQAELFHIKRVRFFPREIYPTTIQIYVGEMADSLIYEEELSSINPMEWNNIVLSNSVEASNSNYLWIVYKMENTGVEAHPIGLDDGPAESEFGDLVSLDNGENWLVLSHNGINGNINLQVEAVDDNGKTLSFANNNFKEKSFSTKQNNLFSKKLLSKSKESLKLTKDVVLKGFNIYRNDLLISEITDENSRSFIDNDITSGETYNYYATAVYEGDIESPHSNTVILIVTEIDEDLLPLITKLYNNYPNPFNPTTTIRFDLANSEKVKISVFNYAGELVSTLVNEYREKGSYSMKVDLTNLSSGVYFYQMKTGSYTKVKKMIMTK
ncbi:MAG: T9SS type A sorting domain-containing protein [Candidatus Delongbacteria bacterium]|nr:T9SS type A sorting domain-containing protein [Candidatus Delongbacteria bacterium]MBN2837101.1 T9SS type A sorting domain-containing protein [Candidatus Delongbacteria bacterium]